jgi:hypothetical protein
MSKVLNGDKLVASVRKRTMTPDDTSIFTDQDILDIMDEEIDVEVLEKLIVLHGDNLTVQVDIPRNANGSYDMPYRAIGNKLRDVTLISGGTVYELSQVSIGSLPDYSHSIDTATYLDNFYVQNNKIRLVAPNRSYDSIRMHYYLRPNVITKLEEAGIISAVVADTPSVGLTTITLSKVGKNFSSSSDYDIVGKRTPNSIYGYDLTPVSVTTGSSGSIVFNTADLEDFIVDIKVGDYVTLAEETPVPNMPTEMHPLIAQAAAIHILESLTDTEALKNAQARMAKMTKAVQTLIDSRVELSPKKIKPRHGTLNSSIGNNRRNRGSN